MSNAQIPISTRVAQPRKHRRWRRSILASCLAVLIVLVVAQFVLPAVAAKVVRESLEPPDRGVSVSVSSFPAVMLLFGHADSASVRIAEARQGGTGGLEKLLSRASHVGRLTSSVERMHLGPLQLTHVYLAKNGSELTTRATVSAAAIEHILPISLHLNAADVATGGMRLSLSTSILGRVESLGARVVARGGVLEIAPELPLFGFVNISLFNDPEVAVTSVSVQPLGSGTYVFTLVGHYV